MTETVKQIGHTGECARKDCGKAPQFRVILGKWRIQAYVCSPHVPWAVRLDMITESHGLAMGWEHGYPVGAVIELRYATVDPLLSAIKRTDFGRDVAATIATSFPIYREPGGIPLFSPITEN